MNIILSTYPDLASAQEAARTLISTHLAACINIIPSVLSVYKWQGSIQQEQETQLIIKTHESKLAELMSYIESTHPYDIPEVVVLDISKTSEGYANWLTNSLQT